jgi:hypothetical protein
MEKNNMAEEKKQSPAKQFKAGALGVSVWEREAVGKVFYAATANRAFTRDDGNTWEYSDSFNRDDLPVVAALMNQAFAWIVEQGAK